MMVMVLTTLMVLGGDADGAYDDYAVEGDDDADDDDENGEASYCC